MKTLRYKKKQTIRERHLLTDINTYTHTQSHTQTHIHAEKHTIKNSYELAHIQKTHIKDKQRYTHTLTPQVCIGTQTHTSR